MSKNYQTKIFSPSDFINFKNIKFYWFIIEFIESKPQKFLSLTESKLASEIGTSQSTISRFSKRLGMKSFRYLQIFVASKLNETKPELNIELNQGNNFVDIKNNILNQYINLPKIVNTSIDEKKLIDLANQILKCDVLLIFGISTSGETALYFCRQLRKFGIFALAFSSIHDLIDAYPAFAKQKKCHYLLLSREAKNTEITEIIEVLQINNEKFTLISKNEPKQMIDKTNLIRYWYNVKKDDFVFDITSKIAVYMILDIVLFYIISLVDVEQLNIKSSKRLMKCMMNLRRA